MRFSLRIISNMKIKSKIIAHLPLIAICIGICMVFIDVTIVNVALPALAKDLNGGVSQLQWVVDGYTLTFACFLLSAGGLADRFSAKKVLIGGFLLFLVSSIFCGIAPGFLFLNISRLLQGFSAALIMPSSLALISSIYVDHQSRSKAIAIWAGLGGISAAIGPVLGAVLITYFGWRSVFLVNIPIAIMGIVLTAKYIANVLYYPKEGHFDIIGQIISILMVATLAFTLIEAGKEGWLSPKILLSFVIFIVILIIFLIIEIRSHYPMLPVQLFKSANFNAAIIVGMIINIGFYGELFILPIYFEMIKGYSILKTGLAILPIVVFSGLFSYFSGKITGNRGSKSVIMLGLSVGALGFLVMILIATMKLDSYFFLILPLLCIGYGITFTVPAATIMVIGSVPKNKSGIASATFNASRQIGSLIGVAVFGSVINAASSFDRGNIVVLTIGAIIFILGWLVSLRFIKNSD
jgi:DHA2 family methylenomycin A resistance protein-like MFS transporter